MKYSEAVLPDRPIIRGNPLACLVVCVWRRLLVLITVQKVLVSFGGADHSLHSQSRDDSVKHSH